MHNRSDIERLNLVEHKFSVGQMVELMPSVLRAAAVGEYEIKQAMPPPDVSSQSPRYRIKSIAEKHERIVPESELTLAGSVTAREPFIPEHMSLFSLET